MEVGMRATDRANDDHILDAIEAELKETSFEQVSMPAIARRLHLTPHSVTKRFRTKLEVADALAARQILALKARLSLCLETGTPTEKLDRFLREPALQWIKTTGSLPGMAAVLVTATERRRRAVTCFRQFIAEKLTALLEEGQRTGEFRSFDSREFARTILDLMSVFGDPRVVHAVPHAELSARTERIVAFVLETVSTPKAAA